MRTSQTSDHQEVEFVHGVGDAVSLGVVASTALNRLMPGEPSNGWRRWAPVLVRPRPVVVLFLAQHLGRAVLQHPGLARTRLRALLCPWEIEQLPIHMREELATADVLVAFSEFNARVLRAEFPERPVVLMPVCPQLPERVTPDRSRWGLADEELVVLYIFDPISGFDRKNPLDVLTAFRRAFGERDDVRLVFKVHGGLTPGADEAGLTGEATRIQRFIDEVDRDERVTVIDELVSRDELYGLMACADIYVSLARAEGQGLPVLEAMALGVPTVCSDWSGHRDFTDADSALLVPCEVVEIAEDASHFYRADLYSSPPRWAQPDLDVAAHHLRTLADDSSARKRWGAAGRTRALAHRDMCESSTWPEELAAAFASTQVLQARPDREAAFQNIVARDTKMWRTHARHVRHARRVLAIRTRLGIVKRRLFGRG